MSSEPVKRDLGDDLLKFLHKRRFLLLAFFIPFFIMLLAYASRSIYPFGKRDLLTIDLYHQYAPFIAELRARLLSFRGIFYSWSGGLGDNFYALFAYYLSSPLNLLIIFFPASALTEAILFLTVLKIGLSGLCFYLFLRGTYAREGYFALAFSVMYALSAYTLSYSWNIMWLDGLYLLPLIILGLVLLIRDGRFMLYSISLALMIAGNYYIAFFVCLFTVLYFPVLLLRYQVVKRISDTLKKIFQFAFFSLAGGALAAVLLVPTYVSLGLTSAAGDTFPDNLTHYYDLFDYIGQHFILPEPTIRDGMPNMYAGLLILIILPLYFLSKRISLREKLSHLLLLIFMLLSFNLNVLNFIWHGFHFPNQLPYRNSFVYIFLLLAMLYPVMVWLRDFPARLIGMICLLLMIITLLNQKLNEIEPSVQSVYVTLIFLPVYAAVLTLDRQHKFSRRNLSKAVLLLVLGELLINTLLMVHVIDTTEYYSTRDGYAAGTQVAAIRQTIQKIDKQDSLFWRMEILQPKTTNDPFLYDYKGLSIFASTTAEEPVKMFQNLGYHSNGINSYKYEGSTLVLDSLFGIKYLLKRGSAHEVEEHMRVLVQEDEQLRLYKNPYALSPGYLGTEALFDWKSAPGNAFEVQNSLVLALGGLPEVLMPVEKEPSEHDNLTLNNNNYSNTYRYSRTDEDQNSIARIKVDNPIDQNLYIYVKVTANQPDEGYVTIDQERISFNARRSTLLDLGHVQAGADIEFNLKFSETAPVDGQFDFYCYALDEQAFIQSMDLLARQSLQVTKVTDNSLKGTLTTNKDGVFLMTIPYDQGWKVKVNGIKTETFAIDNGFLAFNLPAGEHEISLKYTPPWFNYSLLISLGSLIVLLLLYRFSLLNETMRGLAVPPVYPEWKIKDKSVRN